MIFVTVGTERFPFDRLIKAIDDAVRGGRIEGDIFAQTGRCTYKPLSFSFKDFISFQDVAKYISQADIVVSHAGVGSTLLPLTMNKIPILFPRKHFLGEHLDNHQVEFSKQIEKTGKVIVAHDEAQLIEKINNYHKIVATLKPNLRSSRVELVNYLKRCVADWSD